MKKKLLIVFLLLATQLQAQSYLESRRSWNDGPLTLDEFKGRVSNDTSIICLSWIYKYAAESKKVGNTKYTYLKFKPYLDMTESWIREEFRNDNTLRLGQTAFDLLELYGRKATKELAMNTDADMNDMARYYTNQFNRRFGDMELSTQRGQDSVKVNFYATGVALELEQEHFDPTQAPIGEPLYGTGISVGLNTIAPMTDAFTAAPLGFNLGWEIGYKRHLFGLEMALNFNGECKEVIETDKGRIEPGNKVNEGFITMSYAYMLSNRNGRTLYPFVGIGMMSVTGPQLVGSDQKTVANAADGFAFTAGLMYDLPVYRHIYIGLLQNKQAIRIKPFLGFGNISGGPGWVPSLNLAISYVWNKSSF